MRSRLIALGVLLLWWLAPWFTPTGTGNWFAYHVPTLFTLYALVYATTLLCGGIFLDVILSPDEVAK